MLVSHILYKVNNLESAVKEWRKKGFVVEYGKEENPYNALIYFSEGPYIELFNNSGMPKIAKFLLRMIGKGFMTNLMNEWESADEGYISMCLENYEDDLEKELNIYRKHNLRFFKTRGKRKDTQNRHLEYDVAFPDNHHIPFMMTYFNIDPKPKDFVHPNGITHVEKVVYGAPKASHSIIHELCDDPRLELILGEGVKEVIYGKKAE